VPSLILSSHSSPSPTSIPTVQGKDVPDAVGREAEADGQIGGALARLEPARNLLSTRPALPPGVGLRSLCHPCLRSSVERDEKKLGVVRDRSRSTEKPTTPLAWRVAAYTATFVRATAAGSGQPGEDAAAAVGIRTARGGWVLRPSDFTRWKERDVYTKALDQLLRDLRVEKALADRCSACSPRIAVALCEPRLRIITMCCFSTRGSPVPEPGYGSCRRALSTSTTSSSRPAWPRPSCGWRSSVSSAGTYRPSRSGGAKLDRGPYSVCSALAGRRCSGRAPLARQAAGQSRSAYWHYGKFGWRPPQRRRFRVVVVYQRT
jgi:hypothetical protein